jgi:crotonobetainyl-CoA:carnitine CoA-transferase CaiB-like acyl-CoA transferase
VAATEALKLAQTCARGAAERLGDEFAPGQTLLTGRYPCYRVYSAWDGRKISVAALEPRYWREFCEAISSPDLVDQAFAQGVAREEAIERIQRILGSKPWSYWQPVFDERPCCVEPLLSYSEIR